MRPKNVKTSVIAASNATQTITLSPRAGSGAGSGQETFAIYAIYASCAESAATTEGLRIRIAGASSGGVAQNIDFYQNITSSRPGFLAIEPSDPILSLGTGDPGNLTITANWRDGAQADTAVTNGTLVVVWGYTYA